MNPRRSGLLLGDMAAAEASEGRSRMSEYSLGSINSPTKIRHFPSASAWTPSMSQTERQVIRLTQLQSSIRMKRSIKALLTHPFCFNRNRPPNNRTNTFEGIERVAWRRCRRKISQPLAYSGALTRATGPRTLNRLLFIREDSENSARVEHRRGEDACGYASGNAEFSGRRRTGDEDDRGNPPATHRDRSKGARDISSDAAPSELCGHRIDELCVGDFCLACAG